MKKTKLKMITRYSHIPIPPFMVKKCDRHYECQTLSLTRIGHYVLRVKRTPLFNQAFDENNIDLFYNMYNISTKSNEIVKWEIKEDNNDS